MVFFLEKEKKKKKNILSFLPVFSFTTTSMSLTLAALENFAANPAGTAFKLWVTSRDFFNREVMIPVNDVKIHLKFILNFPSTLGCSVITECPN